MFLQPRPSAFSPGVVSSFLGWVCCEISLYSEHPSCQRQGLHGVCAQIPSPAQPRPQQLLCCCPWPQGCGSKQGTRSLPSTVLLHLSEAGRRGKSGDAAGLDSLLTVLGWLAPAQGTAQLWGRWTRAAALQWSFSCSIPCCLGSRFMDTSWPQAPLAALLFPPVPLIWVGEGSLSSWTL